eukprot:1143826-Pelagomonas_calceolata.AAC.2
MHIRKPGANYQSSQGTLFFFPTGTNTCPPQTYLVMRKTAEEIMAVKTGDKNQEMTTGVNPLRKGNCTPRKRIQCDYHCI